MKRKWYYLSFRVKACVVCMCVLGWLTLGLVFWLSRGSWFYLTLTAVLGLLSLMLNISVVVWVLLPYNRLDRNMQLFLSGYTAEGLRNPEYLLSPVTEQFFSMVTRALSEDELLQTNKRQAQYLALQNQINPHFLYNTLESIRSEAMEAGIESVMNMTEALANFFRYTISKVENLVTLEEELQNIETYFFIQKYRFEERIGLSIECEPEDRNLVFRALLPKLTLQPLVENCIIHGLERKLGKGMVRITIKFTEKRLIIQVSDDGVGMSKELLEQLNRRLSQPVFESIQLSKQDGGIAMVNVNNRIHLMFGDEYGLSLYSTPGLGTDMVISLPFVTSRRQIENGEALQ